MVIVTKSTSKESCGEVFCQIFIQLSVNTVLYAPQTASPVKHNISLMSYFQTNFFTKNLLYVTHTLQNVTVER